MRTVVKVTDVHKSFEVGTQIVPVLKGIDLTIIEGNLDIIFGSSGSGKSTLLHTILGLEAPSKGSVELLGKDLYKNMSEDERSDFRKRHVGMVYQQPNWVKSENVLVNVSMPLLLLGENLPSRQKKTMEILDMVKMGDWAYHHPSELSSGQQQKAAFARALISNPELVIADEPTGNLDYESGLELMDFLRKACSELGKTVIMVTHDLEFLKYADRAVKVMDGKIIDDVDKKEIGRKFSESVIK